MLKIKQIRLKNFVNIVLLEFQNKIYILI